MSEYVDLSPSEKWVCAACQKTLVIRPVEISYMGSAFPVNLPCCPQCGQVYLPEDLALGKMADVEKSLEDK
jgi:hypothetical protein